MKPLDVCLTCIVLVARPAQSPATHSSTHPSSLNRYYRNADGCLVCFDLTNRSSFDSVSKWVEHARSNSGNPLLVFTLVGNKADRQEGREVARAEAEALAAHHGMECTCLVDVLSFRCYVNILLPSLAFWRPHDCLFVLFSYPPSFPLFLVDREITAKDNEAVQGLFHTTAERIFKAVESGPDGEAGAVGSDIVIDGAGRVRLRSTSSSSASSSTGNIVLAPGKASKNSSSAAEGGCC